MRVLIALAALSGASLVGCGSADPAAIDAGLAGADAAVSGVILSYRGNTAELERAYFGYERSGGEVTELYFELSTGGDDGCPSPEAAVPDQILTVSGFAGAEPATRSFDEGVRVHFFDFEGRLRDEIEPAAATEVIIQVEALDVAAGTALATADITFDDGSASGLFFATHCDSLDGGD